MVKKLLAIGFVCACALSAFAGPPAGYNLAWSDEFDKTSVDTNNWIFEVGTGPQHDGWGNNELEYYTNGANFSDSGGYGCLVTKKESALENRGYTSCRMVTRGKQSFKYGYFEVRIKAASGNGLWPAFWTLGVDVDNVGWPAQGEVELYEQRTGAFPRQLPPAASSPGDNCFVQTCHYAATYAPWYAGIAVYNTNQTNYTDGLYKAFHTYAILWDSLGFTYYFDGTQTWQYTDINKTNNVKSFHQPHYFIANIAVGGAYQGQNGAPFDANIFPQTMYIDYIRVYQKGFITGANVKPNAETKMSISLVNPTSATMKIYDVNGALVADLSSKVHAMRVGANAFAGIQSNLKPGAYVAALNDNGRVQSKKLLVSN